VTASGGRYDPESITATFDFVQPYLRCIFGFIGVAEMPFTALAAPQHSLMATLIATRSSNPTFRPYERRFRLSSLSSHRSHRKVVC
jgi:hypothetical protein